MYNKNGIYVYIFRASARITDIIVLIWIKCNVEYALKYLSVAPFFLLFFSLWRCFYFSFFNFFFLLLSVNGKLVLNVLKLCFKYGLEWYGHRPHGFGFSKLRTSDEYRSARSFQFIELRKLFALDILHSFILQCVYGHVDATVYDSNSIYYGCNNSFNNLSHFLLDQNLLLLFLLCRRLFSWV